MVPPVVTVLNNICAFYGLPTQSMHRKVELVKLLAVVLRVHGFTLFVCKHDTFFVCSVIFNFLSLNCFLWQTCWSSTYQMAALWLSVHNMHCKQQNFHVCKTGNTSNKARSAENFWCCVWVCSLCVWCVSVYVCVSER